MKRTQGRQLIDALRRRPMTYMEMLALGVSTCPHKRVRESLAADEVLVKQKRWMGGTRYLVTWFVSRAKVRGD